MYPRTSSPTPTLTHFARAIVVLCVAALTALAPAEALASDAIPEPGTGPSPVAQSNLRSWTESARFGAPGVLEVEAAYRASIAGARALGNNAALHTGDLLLDYTVNNSMGFRLGWRMFGAARYAPDFSEVGTGNIHAAGKFALVRTPEANFPHQLSLVGRLDFPTSQPPIRAPGVGGSALALYTIRFNQVELDANAGLAFNTSGLPSYVSLPLGARISWVGIDGFDVFGEFVQTLHFSNLRNSGTLLAGGCSYRPVNAVDLSVTGGVGLSTSLPAGFIQFAVAFQAGSPRMETP